MKLNRLAHKAYEEWDLHGGKALGHWGAPYTEEAWIRVVQLVLRETSKRPARDEAITDEAYPD